MIRRFFRWLNWLLEGPRSADLSEAQRPDPVYGLTRQMPDLATERLLQVVLYVTRPEDVALRRIWQDDPPSVACERVLKELGVEYETRVTHAETDGRDVFAEGSERAVLPDRERAEAAGNVSEGDRFRQQVDALEERWREKGED